MSYWVYLKDDDGGMVPVPRHSSGGTAAVAGVTQAELNVTYNYSDHFYDTLDEDDGLRWLDGKTAKDVEDDLRAAVDELGTDQDEDYWNDTAGNAGHALSILLDWAQQHPDATFEVSG